MTACREMPARPGFFERYGGRRKEAVAGVQGREDKEGCEGRRVTQWGARRKKSRQLKEVKEGGENM